MTVTDEARAEWPIDDGHKATILPGHCDLCHTRMPCDLALAVVTIHELADLADRLAAELDR